MKTPCPNNTAPEGSGAEEGTGLPWLRTWHRVYAFVLGWFVTCLLLLWLLTEVFQ